MVKSISTSEISTYMKCPQRHYLSYTKRLVRTGGETGPIRLGTVYHEIMSHILQASYRSAQTQDIGNRSDAYLDSLIDWTARMWDEANRPEKFFEIDGIRAPDERFYERWNSTITTAKILAKLTVQRLDLWNRFEVLDTRSLDPKYRTNEAVEPLIEYKFSYPVEGTNYVFNGLVDAVVRDRDSGLTVVLDWKTKGKFISEADEMMNMQVGLYQYVLGQMGMTIHRGLLYQIKSSISKPELNKPDKKTGIAQMSRRMITTTWDVYRDELLANGLDPVEYDDMRVKLLAQENDLFFPLEVYRSPTFLANLWINVRRHIQQIENDESHAMALGYACYECPFNELCRAQLEGWPLDDIIETHFISLPPRVVAIEESDEE